uniref:Uncharacterized protein n=1 Tax=Knipowitschia caucasica TaxID=637954 RepID=A0AAV2LTP5_KNICA
MTSCRFSVLALLLLSAYCWAEEVRGMEHNFRKIATLNQGTSYDYGSVMQYHSSWFTSEAPEPSPLSRTTLEQIWNQQRPDLHHSDLL